MKQTNISKIVTITGIILALMLLLLSIGSTWFFISVLQVSVLEWSIFNACAPSSFVYLICFLIYMLTKKNILLPVAIIPLFFFGTMGLFVFPWSGTNLFAQASHIVMTLNIGWLLYVMFKTTNYKSFTMGLLLGVFISIPYMSYNQYYCRNHVEDVERILQMK